jgi:hypothetical protein
MGYPPRRVQIFYPGRKAVEWAFHPGRFRPIMKRPTDITVLAKLLTDPAIHTQAYWSD